jgi:hypothetical protein
LEALEKSATVSPLMFIPEYLTPYSGGLTLQKMCIQSANRIKFKGKSRQKYKTT